MRPNLLRWALIGHDPDLLALAEHLAGLASEQIVRLVDIGPARALLAGWAPGAACDDDWEALLDRQAVDAVVIGRTGPDDRRAEQLRKLTQAGLPLIVTQPCGDSMLAFELEMLRQDSGATLLAYLPARWHPASEALARWLSETPGPGPLEQAIFERQLADRSEAGVLGQLTRDLDWARALVGELTQVAAHAPAGVENRYASLGVQLSGPAGVVVRWSVVPGDVDRGKLTLLARQGQATVTWRDPGGAWHLETTTAGRTDAREIPPWSAPAEALARLAGAAAGRPLAPTWMEAARALELAEGVPRSLARGKTIELRADEASEVGAFKGTMAAAGCGLLLATLGVVFVGSLLGGLGLGWARYWPGLVLVLLVAFLLLQSLRFIVPPEGSATSGPGPAK